MQAPFPLGHPDVPRKVSAQAWDGWARILARPTASFSYTSPHASLPSPSAACSSEEAHGRVGGVRTPPGGMRLFQLVGHKVGSSGTLCRMHQQNPGPSSPGSVLAATLQGKGSARRWAAAPACQELRAGVQAWAGIMCMYACPAKGWKKHSPWPLAPCTCPRNDAGRAEDP